MKNKNGIKSLYTFEQLQDSNILLNKKPPVFINNLTYILRMILLVILLLISFLKVDITITAQAAVEPTNDIIVLKSDSKAVIEKIYKKDGGNVEEGETILKLKNIEKEINTKLLNDTKENLEKKKEGLVRLRKSIETNQNHFKAEDSQGIKDEYSNYRQNIDTITVQTNISSNELVRGMDTTQIDILESERESLAKTINTLIDEYNKEEVLQNKSQLKVQIEQSKKELEKITQSIKQAIISYNKKNQDVNSATNDVQAEGMSKIASLKASTLSNVGAKIIEIEDALKAKKIEAEGNQKIIEQLEIKAPRKGRIKFEKNIVKDNGVEISQPLVTILPEGSKNKIVLHLNPSDVKQLEVGKEGSIRFQGEQKKAVKVKVTKISIIPTTTKISKDSKKEEVINVYEAEVEILSNGEEIAYGMLGIAEVKIGRETMWNYIKRYLFGGSKVSI